MSLVLDNLSPEAEDQVESYAEEIGVLPGELAKRMIEAQCGGDKHDKEFLDTFQQFRAGDKLQRSNLAHVLRYLVVHSPQVPHHGTAYMVRPVPLSTKPLSQKQRDLIAKLEQWNAEDATDDPQEVARREAAWNEIEHNMEENRVSLPVPEV